MAWHLHLHGARGFQDAPPRLSVRVHLHLSGVDARVDHHPRPSAKLPARGNVNEHYKGGRSRGGGAEVEGGGQK